MQFEFTEEEVKMLHGLCNSVQVVGLEHMKVLVAAADKLKSGLPKEKK